MRSLYPQTYRRKEVRLTVVHADEISYSLPILSQKHEGVLSECLRASKVQYGAQLRTVVIQSLEKIDAVSVDSMAEQRGKVLFLSNTFLFVAVDGRSRRSCTP